MNKQQRHCSRSIKSISMVVLSVFCIGMLQDFTYAVSAPVKSNIFCLSPQHGKVLEEFHGMSKEKIYLIQDVHCHAETQKNIKEIITYLKDYHGKSLSVIGAEGTSGKISTSILGKIENKKIKNAVVQKLLTKGYISGAELYNIENPEKNIELYGIEDEELYKKDFELLYKCLEQRKKIEHVLGKVRRIITRGKKLLYPSEIKEIEEIEKQGFDAYIPYLWNKSKETGIRYKGYKEIEKYVALTRIKKELRLNTINQEARQVVRKMQHILTQKDKKTLEEIKQKDRAGYYLYLHKLIQNKNIGIQKGYPELERYFKYLERKEKIYDMKLMEEIKDLGYEVKEKMIEGRGDGEKVLYCDRYMGLLEGCIGNKLSIRDVEEWGIEKDKFYKNIKALNRLLSYKDHFGEEEKSIGEIEGIMGKFYDVAIKRNEALARNILKKTQTEDNRQETRNYKKNANRDKKKSSVSIMVIGGFHTEGITEILRNKGISYAVIMPNVTGKIDEKVYVQRLKEQGKWLGIGETTGKTRYIASRNRDEKNYALTLMSAFATGEIQEQIVEQNEILLKAGIGQKERITFFKNIASIDERLKKSIEQAGFLDKDKNMSFGEGVRTGIASLVGVSFLKFIVEGALKYTGKIKRDQIINGALQEIKREQAEQREVKKVTDLAKPILVASTINGDLADQFFSTFQKELKTDAEKLEADAKLAEAKRLRGIRVVCSDIDLPGIMSIEENQIITIYVTRGMLKLWDNYIVCEEDVPVQGEQDALISRKYQFNRASLVRDIIAHELDELSKGGIAFHGRATTSEGLQRFQRIVETHTHRIVAAKRSAKTEIIGDLFSIGIGLLGNVLSYAALPDESQVGDEKKWWPIIVGGIIAILTLGIILIYRYFAKTKQYAQHIRARLLYVVAIDMLLGVLSVIFATYASTSGLLSLSVISMISWTLFIVAGILTIYLIIELIFIYKTPRASVIANLYSVKGFFLIFLGCSLFFVGYFLIVNPVATAFFLAGGGSLVLIIGFVYPLLTKLSTKMHKLIQNKKNHRAFIYDCIGLSLLVGTAIAMSQVWGTLTVGLHIFLTMLIGVGFLVLVFYWGNVFYKNQIRVEREGITFGFFIRGLLYGLGLDYVCGGWLGINDVEIKSGKFVGRTAIILFLAVGLLIGIVALYHFAWWTIFPAFGLWIAWGIKALLIEKLLAIKTKRLVSTARPWTISHFITSLIYSAAIVVGSVVLIPLNIWWLFFVIPIALLLLLEPILFIRHGKKQGRFFENRKWQIGFFMGALWWVLDKGTKHWVYGWKVISAKIRRSRRPVDDNWDTKSRGEQFLWIAVFFLLFCASPSLPIILGVMFSSFWYFLFFVLLIAIIPEIVGIVKGSASQLPHKQMEEESKFSSVTGEKFVERVGKALGILTEVTFSKIADQLWKIREKITENMYSPEDSIKQTIANIITQYRADFGKIETEYVNSNELFVLSDGTFPYCMGLYISKGMVRVLESARRILPAEIFNVLLYQIIKHECIESSLGGVKHHAEALAKTEDTILLKQCFLPLLENLFSKGDDFSIVTAGVIDESIRTYFSMYFGPDIKIENKNEMLRCYYKKDKKRKDIQGVVLKGGIGNGCTINIEYNDDGSYEEIFLDDKEEEICREIYNAKDKIQRRVSIAYNREFFYDTEGGLRHIRVTDKKTGRLVNEIYHKTDGSSWGYYYNTKGTLTDVTLHHPDHEKYSVGFMADKVIEACKGKGEFLGWTIKITCSRNGTIVKEYINPGGLCEHEITYDKYGRKVIEKEFRHEKRPLWFGYRAIPTYWRESTYLEFPSEEVTIVQEFTQFDEQGQPLEGLSQTQGFHPKPVIRTIGQATFKQSRGTEPFKDNDSLEVPKQLINYTIGAFLQSIPVDDREKFESVLTDLANVTAEQQKVRGIQVATERQPRERKKTDPFVWIDKKNMLTFTPQGLEMITVMKSILSRTRYREFIQELIKYAVYKPQIHRSYQREIHPKIILYRFFRVRSSLEKYLYASKSGSFRPVHKDIDRISKILGVSSDRLMNALKEPQKALLQRAFDSKKIERMWEEKDMVYIAQEMADGLVLLHEFIKNKGETKEAIEAAFQKGEKEADSIHVLESPILDIQTMREILKENKVLVAIRELEKSKALKLLGRMYSMSASKALVMLQSSVGDNIDGMREYDIRQLQALRTAA